MGYEKKQKSFVSNDLLKLKIDLDGMWLAVETCWSDKCYTSCFVLSDQHI